LIGWPDDLFSRPLLWVREGRRVFVSDGSFGAADAWLTTLRQEDARF